MSTPPASEPSLAQLLGDWTIGFRSTISNFPKAPLKVRKASEELIRRLGDLTPRQPRKFELDEVLRAIDSAWRTDRSLAGVPNRYLKRASWVLFYPPAVSAGWLANDRQLVRTWLAWLGESERSTPLIALFREFLRAYPEELASFEDIRAEVRHRLRSRCGAQVERWRERSERFGLLERDAPKRFAQEWFGSSTSFEEFLGEAGLAPGLEASRFVKRATEEILGIVKLALEASGDGLEVCKRAFGWLASDGRLRLGDLKVATAQSLLGPFESRSPGEVVQTSIGEFLKRAIGDPRTDRASWIGVPDTIRNVLLRWLVGASLDDFFRILDSTALDGHWRYRKAFWTAYFNRGVISDAWVVFGPEAARIVRRNLSAEGGAGRLRKTGNVESRQSVLLMRISNLTIAEWSHNGKCRIWQGGNSKVPRLYEAEYRRPQLVDACDWEKAHMGAPEGRWQADVARYIADHTGIRVRSDEFMPKRRR
jgi:hypothetical protein